MNKWEQLKNRASSQLCPPGSGVFTVHTAAEQKNALHKALYGVSADPEKVKDAWLDTYSKFESGPKTMLLGLSSDCGGGILRGANWGPLFVREKLLENKKEDLPWQDLGDIRVIPHLLHDKYLNNETLESCREALYENKTTEFSVSPLSIAEEFLDEFYSLDTDKKILGIGGDHSVSYPLVKTYLNQKRKKGIKVGLVHFDAHTDLLDKRLGIDICFGSWVTHILNGLESPSLVHQVGIRSSGKKKEHWEKTFGVHQYWSNEVISKGPKAIGESILESLKSNGVEEIYLSFDIDALDEQYASATGTPETGGLAPDQCATIIDIICQEIPLTGADLVEIAPFLKTNKKDHQREPDTTLMSGKIIANRLIEYMN